MEHHHDPCSPGRTDADATPPDAAPPVREVSPVIEVTPFSLESEVIARSAQIPVVLLIGSPVDPGTSALRRDLVARAGDAGLQWILGIVDADRFPAIVGRLRPASLPSVSVIADGTGVAVWTPADASGADGVDCGDWIGQVVAQVTPRLAGLPADTVVAGTGSGRAETADVTADPRMAEAARLVGEGDAAQAVRVYDRMLAENPGPTATAVLRQAQAAVAVLARTKDMDRAAVLAAVADARTGATVEVPRLLRAADVLVLLDRPAEAVDLLSAALAAQGGGEDLRARTVELCRLLDRDAPAARRARGRIAAALF
ncbi:hypothetical protein [Corynebacterium nuruki]|uniref:Thioredoxin n=1 Tax=Corynebacterium nuruki TaxID=1032851 RepID=A0A3D4SXR5_9CORY|nr:hypothetical protein [Corynebacterium nuruki]HCT13817.1 hypothetical protein [Corynebacterium nuruki]